MPSMLFSEHALNDDVAEPSRDGCSMAISTVLLRAFVATTVVQNQKSYTCRFACNHTLHRQRCAIRRACCYCALMNWLCAFCLSLCCIKSHALPICSALLCYFAMQGDAPEHMSTSSCQKPFQLQTRSTERDLKCVESVSDVARQVDQEGCLQSQTIMALSICEVHCRWEEWDAATTKAMQHRALAGQARYGSPEAGYASDLEEEDRWNHS